MRAAVRVGRNVVSAMAVGCEPNPNCGHAAANASVSKFIDITSILTFGRKDVGDGGSAETFNCERTKKMLSICTDFRGNESILPKARSKIFA
jgi:hypothetical protein